MEEDGELLLRLQEPSFVDLKYDDILLADVLRNRNTVYEGAPHGYYVVRDEKDPQNFLLFKFFQGSDVFRALKEARLSFTDPPAEPKPSGESFARHSSRVDPETRRQESSCAIEVTSGILTSGPPIVIASPADDPSFKVYRGWVSKKESNSLVPIDPDIFQTNQANLYCASIKIDGRNFPEFMGLTDLKYRLPVDTGDAISWFYAHGFRQLSEDPTDDITKSWPSEDHPAYLRMVIPEPDRGEVLDTTLHSYADGTRVSLRRWGAGSFIPVRFPSWDWKKNKKTSRLLKLPYIVAIGATDMMATRPWDGNLGLGIPRAKTYFSNPKDADFTTTYDALLKDGLSELDTPTRFTIRFRFPVDRSELEGNSRATSFVYFGNYWPCALQTRSGRPFVPKFGDRIYVLHTVIKAGDKSSGTEKDDESLSTEGDDDSSSTEGDDDSSSTEGDDDSSSTEGDDKSSNVQGDDNIERSYSKWYVQLLAMTLLVPKKDNPSHTSTSEDDWEQFPIKFPNDPMKQETAGSGLPALMDTGSTFSHFPPEVVDEIKTLWLHNEATRDDMPLYCKPDHNLDACDIIFTFIRRESPVEFRCTASRFLKSPWNCEKGIISPIQATITSSQRYQIVLGMNFFWTAFVHFDGRGGGSTDPERGPYIRLAPQRYIDSKGEKFEKEFVLHDGLPGRAHAAFHHTNLKMCDDSDSE